MKKIVALILAACMIFTGVLTAGAFELARHDDTQIAYIEGEASGEFVTIIIKNSEGNIAHINQYDVVDGKYSAKFPVEGSGTFTYSVKEGSNDVTAAALAKVETWPFTMDLFVADQTSGGKYITDDSLVSAIANLENKYSDDDTFKLILGFYDKDNRLVDVKLSSEISVAYDEINAQKKLDYGAVPANVVRIKAFAWENEITLVPAAKADNVILNDMTFGSDDEKVVVAFLGDSISHSGVQQKFLEGYYRTKYPDREVVFVNKGINGDIASRIIERFYYEIMEDKYSPAPQEAAMMIGMNDIQRDLYGEGKTTIDDAKQRKIDTCLANIEEVILLCKKHNITLTLVTPSLYDEDTAFTDGYKDNKIGSNAALGKVGEGVKELAQRYNLPLIDLHTATNKWTEVIRAKEPGAQAITGIDRIHPDNFGGFVMGYEFVKQQGNSPVIASVNIDAVNQTAKAENAKVTSLAITANGVSYTYKANSLPVAYNASYKKAEETYGIPVTEDINNEIIKVTGLDESATYTIKMNGTALTKTYTGSQLEEGVNIAIDANNPGQKTALSIDAKIDAKWLKERALRQIPSIEATVVRLKDVCNTGIDRREDVGAYLADPANAEAFVYSDYLKSSPVYVTWVEEYNRVKPIHAQEWAAIEELDAQANALAVTEEITVVIEKQ